MSFTCSCKESGSVAAVAPVTNRRMQLAVQSSRMYAWVTDSACCCKSQDAKAIHGLYMLHSVDTSYQGKLRLDAFLTAQVPQASRGKLQASIKAGNVSVNGKQELKTSSTVRPGDHVQCVLLDAPVMHAIPEVSSLHQCCNKFVYRPYTLYLPQLLTTNVLLSACLTMIEVARHAISSISCCRPFAGHK